MKNLINKKGLTIKELKNWIKDLPEVDDVTGADFEVWINHPDPNAMVSNICTAVIQLNKGDIILES